MRQEGTQPQAFTGKDLRLHEANRRGARHDFPPRGSAMGARLTGQGPTDARAVTAAFCQHGGRAAFRVIARRRLSSTGGEARPAPRSVNPALYARISDESMRTRVKPIRAFCLYPHRRLPGVGHDSPVSCPPPDHSGFGTDRRGACANAGRRVVGPQWRALLG
jgi:hypothetical protein